MERKRHIQTLNELSASEGVFTTAQAARLGVSRNVLAKACEAGSLVRIVHGAYRMAGVPPKETDELAALWKMTDAPSFTHERARPSGWDGVAVGGATAANLLGIGDFYLSPYVLLAPVRMRSRFPGVTFAVRDIAREDVTFTEGLPVTKAERTLLDLALLGEDPSLVRDALSGARGLGLDEERLRDLAGSCGSPSTVARVCETIFGGDAWE